MVSLADTISSAHEYHDYVRFGNFVWGDQYSIKEDAFDRQDTNQEQGAKKNSF